MSLFEICRWLEHSAVANLVNGPEWMFPVIESIHILGLTLLVGTVTMVSLRLLGLRVVRRSPWELAQRLRSWTRLGLIVMLVTGPMMFCADATRYYFNEAFHFKMVALSVALLFHFTLYRKAIASKDPPAWAKLAGCLALALWIGVIIGGRGIGVF